MPDDFSDFDAYLHKQFCQSHTFILIMPASSLWLLLLGLFSFFLIFCLRIFLWLFRFHWIQFLALFCLCQSLFLLLLFFQFVLIGFICLQFLRFETLRHSFLFLYPLHQKGLDWRFIKSTLNPYSIHLQASLSILQQATVDASFNLNQSCILEQLLQLRLLEVVDADSIMLNVKIVFELAISFVRHVDLAEVIPAVVPEEEAGPRLHPLGYFINDFLVFFRYDGRQHEDHGQQVGLGLKGDLVLHNIAYPDIQFLSIFSMIFHLVFDQLDSLR